LIAIPAILLYEHFSYREMPADPPQAISSEPSLAAYSCECAICSEQSQSVNLVTEQAEQNSEAVAQNVEQQLWPDFGSYNETYQGTQLFGVIPFSVPLLVNF
jgi:hypothetical protein